MNEINPYQPPPPVTAQAPAAGFNADGRTLDAGHGWTWIASAFALFMKQPAMWVLLFIIYFVCCAMLGMLPFLGGLANMLLLPVFGAGFMSACRTADNNEEIAVEQLFAGFKNKTSDLMLVGLFACVPLLVVMAGLMLAGGAGIFAAMLGGSTHALMALGMTFVLVVCVALLISLPVYMALWFAAPLVIFHGLRPAAALKASFSGCLKNLIAFTLYGIILIVLFMAAAIPFGLGLIVMVPVALISVYTAYREIFFSA